MKEKYQKLIKNLNFYHDNLEMLGQRYLGKYLVIWEQQIAGIYGSYDEAQAEAISKFEPGTYLLKHCQVETQLPKRYAVKNNIFQADNQA